ncbi:hypothetical protein M427DRAFT_499426 [Gonapodya prolifera JEL478]|uniref:Glycoside hydrolase family 5 C-terminal domain-containing protein n=1 Tax=Gonapodya prolifera (strain JEL478) TaxID=1344416 RepID=A0A139AC38_GONPJ|nr:hypothetical protein M427DRAFT_499426 [Gonapodya prolifera JEL478]|eukprot:KXS14298.1 hypothetical protein M427DRAFT_499426 [Gonapodya prolifera JEL478]
MEPAFKKNVFTRPNIKNLIYAPHHYDWRFILDALYSQMHFWIKEGGLTDPVNAFLDNPTLETQARMLQRLNAMKVLGLFDVLKGLLPVLSPFEGDTIMDGFIKDSQTSLSNAPVFLGEFGVDNHLAAGWTQWAYIPTWDPILKDRFNYEDLSITQGSQSSYAKRPTMMTGRPHVRKVAGIPMTISVSKSPVALSLSYNATSVATGLTEIFFDTGAAYGSGIATVAVSRSNAQCGFAANTIVVCDSTNVTVGSIVSVKVSC